MSVNIDVRHLPAPETQMKKTNKGWIIHLAIRLIAIPVLFAIIYLFVLNGRGDPMGLGLVYAVLLLIAVVILFLGVEAIVLYRKKAWSRLYCNVLLLAIALFFILDFITAS